MVIFINALEVKPQLCMYTLATELKYTYIAVVSGKNQKGPHAKVLLILLHIVCKSPLHAANLHSSGRYSCWVLCNKKIKWLQKP